MNLLSVITITFSDFNIISFNCNGFKSFAPFINDILVKCDIFCVQELMLTKQECNILNSTHDDFYGACGCHSLYIVRSSLWVYCGGKLLIPQFLFLNIILIGCAV